MVAEPVGIRLNVLDRYLTLWVFLAMAAGRNHGLDQDVGVPVG